MEEQHNITSQIVTMIILPSLPKCPNYILQLQEAVLPCMVICSKGVMQSLSALPRGLRGQIGFLTRFTQTVSLALAWFVRHLFCGHIHGRFEYLGCRDYEKIPHRAIITVLIQTLNICTKKLFLKDSKSYSHVHAWYLNAWKWPQKNNPSMCSSNRHTLIPLRGGHRKKQRPLFGSSRKYFPNKNILLPD